MAPAAPFARNLACRGISVIYFSVFKICYVLLSFLTLYYEIRSSRGSNRPVCHEGVKVRYGYPRSITIIARSITTCYVLTRSVAFWPRPAAYNCLHKLLPRRNTFYRSVNVSSGRNVDTMQFKAVFVSFI